MFLNFTRLKCYFRVYDGTLSISRNLINNFIVLLMLNSLEDILGEFVLNQFQVLCLFYNHLNLDGFKSHEVRVKGTLSLLDPHVSPGVFGTC